MIQKHVVVRCVRRWFLTMAVVALTWVAFSDSFDREIVGLLVVGVLLLAVEAAVGRRWERDEPQRGSAHIAVLLVLTVPMLVPTVQRREVASPVLVASMPMPRFEAAIERLKARTNG